MKWQEKLAILKMAGYVLRESENWKRSPAHHWRYVCEIPDAPDTPFGAQNTEHGAVRKAFDNYMWELKNGKAS